MKLQGIVPPIITPLKDRDVLDVDGLEKLVEHMLGGGVHGIFVLGSTGEAPSLSYAVRREMITRVCRQAGDRVPVVVGVTDTSITESLVLAGHAADSGADAIVAAPPFYFPSDPPELLEYFQHLNSDSPLPLILYNMPGLTKVNMTVDTVEKLMVEPNIVGIKDSSCNMMYYQKLLKLAPKREGWFTLIGPEELLCESVMQGGHGGVNGGANLAPKLYVDTYNAVINQQFDRALAIQKQILQLGDALYGVGKHVSSCVKGIKCALSVLGICDDYMADPLHRFREPERKVIIEHLQKLVADGVLDLSLFTDHTLG
ncbi:MAG TPA: dihydrodipicolinate synthase family protein [Phycisphaerales bacterium]|nr:dihydrodipicolinate synthase family protein [Phycisphaerales bacterium]HCD34641.1 dihydrodipicolinate synthase family protein [Phycisphaerales bacterium]